MKIRFSGLKEFVYTEVKEKLINNSIKPGERIWEDKIAEELGVSRTPVREAINRLIAEELIENRPRKGLFATEISNKELEKMLDIRIALETLAAKMCCEMITESQKYELKSIFENYKAKLNSNKYVEASQLDSEIHRFIAKVSDSKRLVTYINELEDVFAYTRTNVVKWTQEKKVRSISDHQELVEAICNHDDKHSIKMIQQDINAMRDLLK